MDLRAELSLEFAKKHHKRSFEEYVGLGDILQKLFDQGQCLTTLSLIHISEPTRPY